MTRKVYNVGGGRHSEAALSALLSQLLEGDVARGLNIEPTGSAGLSVRIAAGTGQIRVSQFHSRMIQSDAAETTTAVPAPTSNPRRNLVVAYIDPAVTPTTSVVDNTNGVFKFAVIQGAEAATPQIPTNTAVTAALGTENWIPLGDFRTNVGATSVVLANITDQRRMILVTSDKIDYATLNFGNYSTTEKDTGFKYTDGKTIFKRTFTGTISAAASTRAETVLMASGVSTILTAAGYITDPGGAHVLVGQDWHGPTGSSYIKSYVQKNASGAAAIYSWSSSARTNTPFEVSITYTKA